MECVRRPQSTLTNQRAGGQRAHGLQFPRLRAKALACDASSEKKKLTEMGHSTHRPEGAHRQLRRAATPCCHETTKCLERTHR